MTSGTTLVMKFSLILATKSRVAEVARFVRSLTDQAHDDLELIVVDQNGDERLEKVFNQTKVPFSVVHLRSEPGLSRARNVGLGFISGEVVAFPDDDCWYPEGLLARIALTLQSDPSIDGLTGRSEDEQGQPSGGCFSRRQGTVDIENVWKQGISYTIFLRSPVCSAVGRFDEELGVGARTRFGSGEETDYLIRALIMGFNIRYLPDLVVHHPNPVLYDRNHRAKAFRYGAGMGRVLAKHRYTLGFSLVAILRPLAGTLLSLLTFRGRKAAYHLAVAGGRICGLWVWR